MSEMWGVEEIRGRPIYCPGCGQELTVVDKDYVTGKLSFKCDRCSASGRMGILLTD